MIHDVLFGGLKFKTLNLWVKHAIREINLIKTLAALKAGNVEVYVHSLSLLQTLKKLCTQAGCSGLFSV